MTFRTKANNVTVVSCKSTSSSCADAERIEELPYTRVFTGHGGVWSETHQVIMP
jgi:hypothetical protein